MLMCMLRVVLVLLALLCVVYDFVVSTIHDVDVVNVIMFVGYVVATCFLSVVLLPFMCIM